MPKQIPDEVAKFIQPLLQHVDFRIPELAAASCGCGCGCSGGGGGGGGGGSGKIARDLLVAAQVLPKSETSV